MCVFYAVYFDGCHHTAQKYSQCDDGPCQYTDTYPGSYYGYGDTCPTCPSLATSTYEQTATYGRSENYNVGARRQPAKQDWGDDQTGHASQDYNADNGYSSSYQASQRGVTQITTYSSTAGATENKHAGYYYDTSTEDKGTTTDDYPNDTATLGRASPVAAVTDRHTKRTSSHSKHRGRWYERTFSVRKDGTFSLGSAFQVPKREAAHAEAGYDPDCSMSGGASTVVSTAAQANEPHLNFPAEARVYASSSASDDRHGYGAATGNDAQQQQQQQYLFDSYHYETRHSSYPQGPYWQDNFEYGYQPTFSGVPAPLLQHPGYPSNPMQPDLASEMAALNMNDQYHAGADPGVSEQRYWAAGWGSGR